MAWIERQNYLGKTEGGICDAVFSESGNNGDADSSAGLSFPAR